MPFHLSRTALALLLVGCTATPPGSGGSRAQGAPPAGKVPAASPNGSQVVANNGATLVGNNGSSLVSNTTGSLTLPSPAKGVGTDIQTSAQNLQTPLGPLKGAASIIGKLKSGPAELIANNSATLLGLGGSGLVSDRGGGIISDKGLGLLAGRSFASAYRLLSLEDQPRAGAQVRLVDPQGNPLTDQVTTTDAEGAFTLQRPEGVSEALVQATFDVAGKSMEYLAVAPPSGPLEVDTATTLAAARWRADRLAGRASALPGANMLARLRTLLGPGTVPFLGRGSRDVADAFDQFVNDDDTLRTAIAQESPELAAPARPSRVEPWYSSETLQALGALPDDAKIKRGETSVFSVDGEGRLYMVVKGAPTRIIRITQEQKLETVATVPVDSVGPYAITFSPGKLLYLVHLTTANGIAVNRLEDGKLVRLFATPPNSLDIADFSQGRIAAADTGELYFSWASRHLILVARPGAPRLERYAGKLNEAGYQDGARLEARFNLPRALAVAPDGRLYVADRNNHCIRRIEPDGRVITVAGKPGETSSRFGRGGYARLGEPGAIAVAADGTMYATDVGIQRALVLRLSPDGSVFLVAGGNARGKRDGNGPDARFITPVNLELDNQGNLYLEDLESLDGGLPVFTLRKIVPPQPSKAATSPTPEAGVSLVQP
ncbi:MAG: hypothetical protein VKP62_06910 [Candidatus Sericytochromatia bacterium]|nr:hypothetical protein [Candidatus Sericytochromatia bacterium]